MRTSWEWLDNSKTIVLITVRGDWSRSEVDHYSQSFWPHMAAQPHQVDVIVDLRSSGVLPLQPVALLIELAQHRPANAGHVVFIVKRLLGLALVQTIHHTMQRLYPRFQVFGVMTQEEALRLLQPPPTHSDSEISSQAEADNQSPTVFPQ